MESSGAYLGTACTLHRGIVFDEFFDRSRKNYKTPQVLRTALEARLLELAKRTSTDLQRLRRRVAFDRLLARMFSEKLSRPAWYLKGGYAIRAQNRERTHNAGHRPVNRCARGDLVPVPAQDRRSGGCDRRVIFGGTAPSSWALAKKVHDPAEAAMRRTRAARFIVPPDSSSIRLSGEWPAAARELAFVPFGAPLTFPEWSKKSISLKTRDIISLVSKAPCQR
jgi:hypothetical protein